MLKMDTYCEHLVGEDDENLLLDDENTSSKCAQCDKKSTQWPENVTLSTEAPINGFIKITTHPNNVEEHLDHLEDSPLLINDSYSRNADQFHCHSVITLHDDRKAWKKLLIASLLCFIFMITELIGGYIAGSLAVMTDAAHLFSDFVGFLISLISIWMARKTSTRFMTFGYYRVEVLGALLSVLTVWLLAAIFAVLAINRLYKKAYDIEADTMILVASLGLLVNIAMGAVLYGFCHNHSHGLPHSHPSHSDHDNINVRAAAAHVLGDLLQSFGVLVAAIIIKIFPSAQLADPICTLIFSVVIICTTANVAKDSIWLLLEGSPKDSTEIALELQTIPSVRHVHNLHIWTLSPGKEAISVHLCVDKYCDRDLILKKATSIIQMKLNVISCTIQVEVYNPEQVNSCYYCQSPNC